MKLLITIALAFLSTQMKAQQLLQFDLTQTSPCSLQLEKIKENQYQVFPNPFNDKIRVECPLEACYYRMTDTQGKLILSGSAEAIVELEIPTLSSGIYVFQLLNSQEIKTFKLLHQ